MYFLDFYQTTEVLPINKNISISTYVYYDCNMKNWM